MGRYKGLIGERLRSRGDAARRTEAVVGAEVLNRMLNTARPNSVRRPPSAVRWRRCEPLLPEVSLVRHVSMHQRPMD